METRKRIGLRVLAALLAIFCLAFGTTAPAAIVHFEDAPNGDFRIAEITGLVVGSETYDVDFSHGGQYTALVTPITFTTQTDALAGAVAIEAAIEALGVDAESSFTSRPFDIFIPYDQSSSPTINIARLRRSSFNPLTFDVAAATANATSNFASTGSITEWATFTAIPEPASAALLALGGLAVFNRRRAHR